MVGLTRWSLGQGCIGGFQPGDCRVSAPTKKERKKTLNHTAATGQAAHSVAISFKRAFFSHHPSPRPPSLKKESAKKLVIAFSLVSVFTVMSLRGTDVLKVLLKGHCSLPVSLHDATLWICGFEVSTQTIYLSKSTEDALTCLDVRVCRHLHGNLVLQQVLEPGVPGQPCCCGASRSRRPCLTGSKATLRT